MKLGITVRQMTPHRSRARCLVLSSTTTTNKVKGNPFAE